MARRNEISMKAADAIVDAFMTGIRRYNTLAEEEFMVLLRIVQLLNKSHEDIGDVDREKEGPAVTQWPRPKLVISLVGE